MTPRNIILTLTAAAALAVSAPLIAGGGHSHGHGGHNEQAEQNQRTAEGVGEIQSVAADGSSVVLDHAPIADLRWPAMTMELALADPALADGLKAGTKVRFVLRQTGATDYEIIRIEEAHDH